ncbi:MAG: ribonuclease E activity regulator RraA [Rhodocyclaceae bacterium]|jgi:regulator of ribonuclease activity A|nr:putative 4-hydroxy-4-methyl-2-oxoglutarate aldolase [Rhodocyclaceae bacterium]MBZ0142753.1 ribonuclease E activity regulator RraA [Rhodocyclaceae bacterium]
MDFQTADLCDKHEARVRAGEVRVLEPMLNAYGGRDAFHGRIATLKLFEDNSLVRKALESAGEGRVLVIDGGGSLRCALVGDQLAALGVKNGWAGIVVYGCIRDSRAIGEMDLGVLALDSHPLKSIKKNVGEADIPVSFGDVTFTPGDYLYADEDGLLVSPDPLA